MTRSILLVDDDAAILDLLARFFDRRGWTVSRAMTGAGALEVYEREQPELVLLDLDLPDMSGLPVLEKLRRLQPAPIVLMLTGHGDIDTAVTAMQLGAENFLTKPIELDHLGAVIDRAAEKAALRRQNRFLVERSRGAKEGDALGASPMMQEVQHRVERIAAGDAPVLLEGETGTGKRWVARLIHDLSARRDAPFVEVACGGLDPAYLEAELFGHESGAMGGGEGRKPGVLELGHRGTIFLDGIGELPAELQPKLLSVLESGRFRRIGGTRDLEVDVRLLASTHHDLQPRVEDGSFRDDLYYRLAVMPVRLPPLRNRAPADLASLAYRILSELRRDAGTAPSSFSDAALSVLVRHPWPGNIRELRNVIERVLIFSDGIAEIRPHHLPAEIRRGEAPALSDELETLREVERRHIARTLERCEGNRSRAARALGISRATLYEKLDRYGLSAIGR